MLFESMTHEDVYTHLKSEHLSLMPRINGYLNSRQMRRTMVKLPDTKMRFLPIHKMTTKNQTDIYIIPIATYGKKTVCADCFNFVAFTMMKRVDGFYFYIMYQTYTNFTVNVMTPHFMQRYVERNNLSMSPTSIDAILYYIKHDNLCTVEHDFSTFCNARYRKENEYVTVAKSGVSFGLKLTDKLIIYRTFVSNDMLKCQQKDNKQKRDVALDKLYHAGIADANFHKLIHGDSHYINI